MTPRTPHDPEAATLGAELPSGSSLTRADHTADNLLGMLRRHYVPDESRPAGVFATEIQAPGPVGRRADAVWLGCAAATGNVLVGHEVKVSRQDLLAELDDLTKSDPWQKYCDRWYLVVPHESLIQGLEIPESWGVLLPPSGRRTRSMTVWRPAPRLAPLEQALALRVIAARQLWMIRDLTIRAELRDREVERLQSELDRVRALVPRSGPDPDRDMVARIVRKLGGASADGEIGSWCGGSVSVEDVIAALRDLKGINARHNHATLAVKSVRASLMAAQATVTRALAEFDANGANRDPGSRSGQRPRG